jgi:hypothetical protein
MKAHYLKNNIYNLLKYKLFILLMDIYIFLFGAIIGFTYFLYKLEAPDMGNILFRVNSSGSKVYFDAKHQRY